MIERITEILRRKNLTPSQFADEIGIQRSGMSHLISGRNKPSLEFILKVLKRFPDIDPVWLLFGTTKPTEKIQNSDVVESLMTNLTDESPTRINKNSSQKIDEFDKKEDLIEKIIILYKDNSFKEYHKK